MNQGSGAAAGVVDLTADDDHNAPATSQRMTIPSYPSTQHRLGFGATAVGKPQDKVTTLAASSSSSTASQYASYATTYPSMSYMHEATFHLVNMKEFKVKVSPYTKQTQKILNIVRLTPGARFDWKKLHWVVAIASHEMLTVTCSRSNISVEPLPRHVLSIMTLQQQGAQLDKNGMILSTNVSNEVKEKVPRSMIGALASFQIEAVEFAMEKKGRVLIADEMGLGKTRTAIACATCYREDWPVLIVCPSAARSHWKNELITLLCTDRSQGNESIAPPPSSSSSSSSAAAAATATATATTAAAPSRPVIDESQILSVEGSAHMDTHLSPGIKITVASYNMVPPLVSKLASSKWKFNTVIVDECHYMKNNHAMRTKVLVPLIQRAKRAFLLSGTPALSRPLELYTQLHALQPGLWGDEKAFAKRYCKGKKGAYRSEYNGASNTAELQLMLLQSIMIRRLKKDILKHLPEKLRHVTRVSVIDEKLQEELRELVRTLREREEEREQWRKHQRNMKKSGLGRYVDSDDLAAEREKAIGDGLPSTELNAAPGGAQEVGKNGLHAVEQESKRNLMLELYRKSGLAKLPGVLVHLDKFLDGPISGKILIFAHHHSVLDGIEAHLKARGEKEVIRIDGKTGSNEKFARVTRFQNNPKCRVAVLAITAAGVAVTLTAASTVFFAEMFWNPGALFQAEDRAHRIGQTATVNIHYFKAAGTIDDFLYPLLVKKAKVLEDVGVGRRQVFDTKDAGAELTGEDIHMDSDEEAIYKDNDKVDDADANDANGKDVSGSESNMNIDGNTDSSLDEKENHNNETSEGSQIRNGLKRKRSGIEESVRGEPHKGNDGQNGSDTPDNAHARKDDGLEAEVDSQAEQDAEVIERIAKELDLQTIDRFDTEGEAPGDAKKVKVKKDGDDDDDDDDNGDGGEDGSDKGDGDTSEPPDPLALLYMHETGKLQGMNPIIFTGMLNRINCGYGVAPTVPLGANRGVSGYATGNTSGPVDLVKGANMNRSSAGSSNITVIIDDDESVEGTSTKTGEDKAHDTAESATAKNPAGFTINPDKQFLTVPVSGASLMPLASSSLLSNGLTSSNTTSELNVPMDCEAGINQHQASQPQASPNPNTNPIPVSDLSITNRQLNGSMDLANMVTAEASDGIGTVSPSKGVSHTNSTAGGTDPPNDLPHECIPAVLMSQSENGVFAGQYKDTNGEYTQAFINHMLELAKNDDLDKPSTLHAEAPGDPSIHTNGDIECPAAASKSLPHGGLVNVMDAGCDDASSVDSEIQQVPDPRPPPVVYDLLDDSDSD